MRLDFREETQTKETKQTNHSRISMQNVSIDREIVWLRNGQNKQETIKKKKQQQQNTKHSTRLENGSIMMMAKWVTRTKYHVKCRKKFWVEIENWRWNYCLLMSSYNENSQCKINKFCKPKFTFTLVNNENGYFFSVIWFFKWFNWNRIHTTYYTHI